ncbi:MAG: cytochrome c peroxidase [Gemmatimonadota bacterium]|jgi:cytochrome c peroxidase
MTRKAGWRTLALLTASVAVWGCDDSTGPTEEASGPTPLEIDVGALPPMPEFPDNPTTVEGVELGRHLFYDPILSGDGTQACGDCHQQALAFGDTGSVSFGITGAPGDRNAQVVVNPAWQDFQFWDGRRATLEDQARDPVVNPVEMAAEWDQVVERIGASSMYPDMFRAAFGSPDVTQDRVVQAIAQFERTFVSANSRFDREARGEAQFTEAEARGRDLFNSEAAECSHCHAGVFFTDNEFHDVGLDQVPVDLGRAMATEATFDEGKFKTPTLRNIEVTAPYMHDGRFATLEDVLAHYSEGIHRSPNLDPTLGVHLVDGATGLHLTEQQRADIIAFLKTLTDTEFLNNPALAPPG